MVGPQLYLESEDPVFQTGLTGEYIISSRLHTESTGNLVVLCIMFGLVILQTFYLIYLNKRNAKRRLASGKTGTHVDYSLENSGNWAKMKADAAAAASGEEGVKNVTVNENAFADLTDLKNEDFIYSL
jgi:hypothetical protein